VIGTLERGLSTGGGPAEKSLLTVLEHDEMLMGQSNGSQLASRLA